MVISYPLLGNCTSVPHKVMENVRGDAEPWRWNFVFDMLPFEGHEMFAEWESFAGEWYALAGDNDRGHRIAVISDDPLIAARFATHSYQDLFPTREVRLFAHLDEGQAWAVEQPDPIRQRASH